MSVAVNKEFSGLYWLCNASYSWPVYNLFVVIYRGLIDLKEGHDLYWPVGTGIELHVESVTVYGTTHD